MSGLKKITLLCLIGAIPFMAGCSTWTNWKEKRAEKKKENTETTVQLEETFKARWLEKRGAELIGQGISPNEAQRQAIEEFRLRYEYTSAAQE